MAGAGKHGKLHGLGEDSPSSSQSHLQAMDFEAVVCNGGHHVCLARHANAHAHPPAAFYSPKEIFEHVVEAGASKATQSLNNLVALGVLAGAYIGFGFALCMIAGGQMTTIRKNDPGLFNMLYGSFGFPMGLTLCVIAGAELFTSNIAYMVLALAQGKATLRQLLYVWIGSYFANLCGALLLMQMFYAGEVFHGREDFTISLAHAKTSHPFGVTVIRGILCNWLVCLAVWQANAAKDIFGKFIGVWLPISGFVAMGFEHCIANMFMIPLSMKLGSGISVSTFIARNLVPATIGNIVGGGFFVATFYAVALGAWDVEANAKRLLKPHLQACCWRWARPASEPAAVPVPNAGAPKAPSAAALAV